MKEISEMQENQDNIKLHVKNNQKNLNIKTVRNTRKPKINEKGIKGFATLIGPKAKEYRLSKNQRTKQLAGRIGIATIAATLGIIGVSTFSKAHTENVNTAGISPVSTTNLEKENAFEKVEDKLLDIIYQGSSSKEDAYVTYEHSNETNADIITVYEKASNYIAKPTVKFSYTRFNSLADKLLFKSKNNPEVSEWLNSVLDAYFDENISKENLEDLITETDNLDAKDFALDGKNILGKSELDKDFER